MSAPHSRFETLAIHAAQKPDPITGGVMPPIHLSSTFAQEGPGVHKGFEYSRTNNPTRQTLERCLAELEAGKHGMAFSSGCGAISTFLHTLRPGDHIVACDDLYGGTVRILDKVMTPFGVTTTYVEAINATAVEAAMRPNTRWLWLETPTNPTLKIIDIAALSAIAHKKGARVMVDNTFATPYLQQPLLIGADAVLHSTTKYLNGHSDVVGGAVITSDDALAEEIRYLQNAMGAVPSPFDCFMVLRSLKTLHVRMDRHVESARALGSWLESQPQIERVYYPGLESHPQYEVAKRQMRAPGGMISIVVKGGAAASRRLLESVKIFVCAESLGGVESLIELPATMTHGGVPAEVKAKLGITDGLIRLSVGLEALQDLRDDLAQAIEQASRAT